MNIGIIGCGNISTAYLRLAPLFKDVNVTACSDLDDSVAQAQASLFNCKAMSIEAMLAASEIDVVINLTVPAAHADVSTRILRAGKHVYSEKPFVLSYEEGVALKKLANEQDKRIGSAPDTFLGGAHQQARKVVDDGEVGKIIGGTCHFMNHGLESWHPNPDFFYQPGAGPILDMGPYYISNLVQLIGPVNRLMSMTSTPFATRTISSEPREGESITVTTPTTINTLLEFHSGAQITLSLSWDVWEHKHNCMELYGTEATLHVPNPNFFGGELSIAKNEEDSLVDIDHPFAIANDEQRTGELLANYRGVGLADMIAAINEGREHRCNDTLALHVVDVMTSALRSGEEHRAIDLQSSCERPAALGPAAARALLA